MLSELEKSELCKTCGKCCQCLVLPVVRPDGMNKAIMEDWLDARGCEVIRETKDNLYVKFSYPCPHLSKSDRGFTCEMYHQRPQGCRIFDGAVYDFLDCAWKKAETKYVVDLNKSKGPWKRGKKNWGGIQEANEMDTYRVLKREHSESPLTGGALEELNRLEEKYRGKKLPTFQIFKKSNGLNKSGYVCPMCGKSAVQVGSRYKQDHLWVRKFRCRNGHMFEEVQ